MVKSFNNKTNIVGDDLKSTIKKDSKIDVAAALFSIYGFEALKKELNSADSLRFIFTDPTFIEVDKNNKQKKQFGLDTKIAQKSIGGTEFEINLKNELKGKTIARECRNWIEKKVKFKTNTSHRFIQEQVIVDDGKTPILYNGINEFSSAGFGFEKDNAILRQVIKTDEPEMTREFIRNFQEVWSDENSLKDVTNEVADYIADLYKENSPEFIYYLTLFHIFNEFLEDITEDELANERTGFKDSAIWNKLYDFQKDSVLGIINKLERHNGCILADSVGLGKTFTALGVMKYYQERNKSVLVLCPKKLGDNWQTFLNNYEDNPLIKDRLNYHVLYHTDLLRTKGSSNNIDLSRINWSNFDLLVIDESHNFRNNDPHKNKENRYQKLLNTVIKSGVKTKILMLSATPVNNRFNDLKNQIALAYEGRVDVIDEKMEVTKPIDQILRNAQKTFNDWSKLPIEQRTGKVLLDSLSTNFDFFKLLDSVTIARSRKHIEKYYDTNKIGKFPNRLKPITHRSEITDIDGFIKVEDIYKDLSRLNLSLYTPFEYILDSKKSSYGDKYDTDISEHVSFTQGTREKSLQKLMRVNLLKRLESSIDSFRITLEKFLGKIDNVLLSIEKFEKEGLHSVSEAVSIDTDEIDLEGEEWIDDDYSIGDKVRIHLTDMNTLGWKEDLLGDKKIADDLLTEIRKVTPNHDSKLQDLLQLIKSKIENPINPGNKKVLIFSAFADTTNYLFRNLSPIIKKDLGLDSAKITGSDENANTLNIDNQFNNLLIHFSPLSKGRLQKYAENGDVDILFATDCISEGQNLQDCDTLINYDIHWNPVRIIQRFGRIDRIGSKNKDIQLVNFWPQLSLDDYINLKNRVETKMFIVDATATGEDNVLTNESADLTFRKKQLEKLQNEVVDLEDMDSSVSITDLGLNDFRMDLISYPDKDKLDNVPSGMHTICHEKEDVGIKKGVIFVLKNINNEVNIDQTNHLHPFYLVYINESGEIVSNHLNVKNTLDILRSIAKGYPEPIKELYKSFNDETDEGRNMQKYSDLLNDSIRSIISVKDETEIDSLFSAGGTTALYNNLKGLEDFELITFVVIK